MSRGALAMLQETQSSKSSTGRASSVRVSQPGDAHEVEADRVADTVSRGGRVAGWSLSTSQADGVQRQATPPPAATTSLSDVAAAVAPAILATSEGKKVLDASSSVVTTPVGGAITGAAAVGILSGLAKAKKPLPAQLPEIPLNFIRKGLSVKLTWNGPVNSPTAGSIVLKYEPKGEEKKPQTEGQKIHAETAALVADREKLKDSVHTAGPVKPKSSEDALFAQYNQRKLAEIGSFVRPLPSVPAPPKAPAATEKKPEIKAAPVLAPVAVPDLKKKEELPVQRKAETAAPVATGSADVDAVVRGSGRPLDASTRRDMESRMGYDFSSVRVHTDTSAAESAQALSAQAYTVGSSVVFAPGRYAPASTDGRHLLAHELTHVVQQTGALQRAHGTARTAPKQVQRKLDIDANGTIAGMIRGFSAYPLVCVVIGEDLISGEPVKRDASTLIAALLKLVPGGEVILEKLTRAKGAAETAYHWLLDRLTALKLTPTDLAQLLDKVVGSISLWSPRESYNNVVNALTEPLHNVTQLAKEIGAKVLDFIFQAALEAFGEPGRKVYAFFKRIGGVISKIAGNPIGFAKNLFAAVVQGFKNFGTNILTHLGEGLKTWIFEELHVKGVEMPTEFSFPAMMKLLLQVLGLTWAQKRELFVKKLGEPMVYFFETSVKVFQRIQKEGFSAVKEMIVEKAKSVYEGLVSGIKNWVIEQIVKRGVEMIAKLSNPAGELLAAVESIYNTVEFLIDKASQLADLINTVVDALNDIADGNTAPAAAKVEQSLAGTIPLLLRFLAGQLGLSGIGASIRKIIDDIRKPIDDTIEKVLDVVIDGAREAWNAGKKLFMEKLDAVKEWWTKPLKFDFGEEKHELTVEGDGEKSAKIIVHSDEMPLAGFLEKYKVKGKKKAELLQASKGITWKKGKVQDLKTTSEGYDKFVVFRDLMSKIRSKTAPKSEIKDDYDVHPQYKTGVKAHAFLTPDHPQGTKPNDSDDPILWQDLGYLRAQKQKYYVRGHLVSNKLGGRGEWTNMTPITNGSNQRMEVDVESTLKSETDKPKNRNYYYYEVNAKYGNPSVPGRNSPDAETLRPLAVEKRLQSVSWQVHDAEVDDGGKWKINRGIKPRDADDNELSGSILKGTFNPRNVKEPDRKK